VTRVTGGLDRPWLIMLMPYFGRWPEWFDLFIESCKWNAGVRWRFYTDCGEPENKAANVEYLHLSFDDYKALVCDRLGVAFRPNDPYKLCDLRPCFGHIHEREIAGYPFFGYGDIDVIYGNIASFYTEELLARFDVLSTHPERLAGHFAVLRNTDRNRRAFLKIRGWRDLLERQDCVALDEGPFTATLQPRGLGRLCAYLAPWRGRSLFVERHSAILSPRGWHDGTMNYPRKWFWRNGRLTNERDGEREFLYLHFMRWKSERWMGKTPAPGEGAWLRLPRVVQVDWQRAAAEGFCISPEGFTELGPTAAVKPPAPYIPPRPTGSTNP
jgi:hypothetical protein